MDKIGFLPDKNERPRSFDISKEIELIKKRLDAIERGGTTWTEYQMQKEKWEDK